MDGVVTEDFKEQVQKVPSLALDGVEDYTKFQSAFEESTCPATESSPTMQDRLSRIASVDEDLRGHCEACRGDRVAIGGACQLCVGHGNFLGKGSGKGKRRRSKPKRRVGL